MGGFDLNKEESEKRRIKRESDDSWSYSGPHKHGRSKSASERDLFTSSDEMPHSPKDFDGGLHKPAVPTTPTIEPNPLNARLNFDASNASSTQRVSLERDIEELQQRLKEERTMNKVLERAMGRASSTLSPGHRHFASQTKELIAEIEVLEEEVAKREQHVLSLYRTMFEQSVSRASSRQTSSVVSPAHTKQQPACRKHPSVISNAFCSSMTFPLTPWNSLLPIHDFTRKSSKKAQASPTASSAQPEAIKAKEAGGRQRTLKDHLYVECPSKLSEEMVKCMASVYFWLCTTPTSSVPDERRRRRRSSNMPSTSTTTYVIPQTYCMTEDRNWSCKSMVEISWISTDKRRFSQASYAINNYRVLVEQLERITLDHMEDDAKLAFWINVYNALIMHAYLAYGVPTNSIRRLALFHKSAYNIGGHIISANTIEHSIFLFHTPRIGRWLETVIWTALRKKPAEDRHRMTSRRFRLPECEPLLCFALCTGSLSDPVLKVYTALNVKEELEAAKREFLETNVDVKQVRKVSLPKILERFGKEMSLSSDDLMRWVLDNVDKKLQQSIKKCLDQGNKKASRLIDWSPYSSSFRYVFSTELMEKPCWV